jgi:hypothetical protein
VARWRDAILEDEWMPRYELAQLARRDPTAFVALCCRLLREPHPEVQRIAPEKLWELGGHPERAVAEAIRLIPTTNPTLESFIVRLLREAASAAISAPFGMAEGGLGSSLVLLSGVLRFPADRLRLISLACCHVLSGDRHLRSRSLALLADALDRRRWEEVDLEVARRYHDEDAYWLLGLRATARVIPVLRWLRARMLADSRESRSIEEATAQIDLRPDKSR